MKSSNISFFFDLEKQLNIPHQDKLLEMAEKIIKNEEKSGDINIIFINDPAMRELNRDYRSLDKTTDVLSFVWGDEMLGEIYISVDQVKKQAPEYENSFYQELKRVLVHGVLHLCGYDHIKPGERKIMRNREEAYLSKKIY